jgi:hypothetical protein
MSNWDQQWNLAILIGKKLGAAADISLSAVQEVKKF